jgi:hypothetical protein
MSRCFNTGSFIDTARICCWESGGLCIVVGGVGSLVGATPVVNSESSQSDFSRNGIGSTETKFVCEFALVEEHSIKTRLARLDEASRPIRRV